MAEIKKLHTTKSGAELYEVTVAPSSFIQGARLAIRGGGEILDRKFGTMVGELAQKNGHTPKDLSEKLSQLKDGDTFKF